MGGHGADLSTTEAGELELRAALRRLLSVTASSFAAREQLENALATRIVIEQAKGILAERLRLSLADAFELLRGTARSTNTSLNDVAREVVQQPQTPSALLYRLQRELTAAEREPLRSGPR
jgi:hypothetical protein